MAQHLETAGSHVLLLPEAQGYEFLRGSTDILPLCIRKLQLILSDCLVNAVLVLAEEGRIARQHDVNDDGGAPHVGLRVVLFVPDDLGRHVDGAAEDLRQLLLLIKVLSEPKVSDLYLKSIALDSLNQDVLGLDVSVRNGLLVHVVQGVEELFGHYLHLLLCHGAQIGLASLDHVVVQLAKSNELTHDEVELVVLQQLVDAHDVRVRRVLKNLKLIFHEV